MSKTSRTEQIRHNLGRRERQILDILYRLGRAGAAQVQSELPDPPGCPAVRKWLFLMEKKGLVRHTKSGRRYIFEAALPREEASLQARKHLVETFFEGSRLKAAAALLDQELGLGDEGVKLLQQMIDRAREKER